MPTAVRGSGLIKRFGSGALVTWALRDLSVELPESRVTAVMGPSGCGKSTLLAVLSGLVEPTQGEVWALGRRLWDLDDRSREAFRRQHCGFLFQGYNLFPALTALQQLEIAIEWASSVPRQEGRNLARELLTNVGLQDKLHLVPHELSGGEKQRVAVARALVKRPELIFADEPTAALDWEHGRHIVEMLGNAAAEFGTTVLLVSHDERVTAMADQVLLLRDGRIEAG